ncbi:MAG TPA: squalene synthase HpnC [Vicinamibacterales bacterium]|nr:squalene synthase HpnC [Vicinamibacterales bacterium]
MVADAAYAACLRLARQHYENFPVASRLLPAEARPHIAAVYAFARIADDFADEGDRSDEARLALLDGWQAHLHRAAAGQLPADGSDESAIFVALGETMRRCGLEVTLFDDLLSAFKQDVVTKRYQTWEELLDYCRRSANPVGRLVLRIAGYRDRQLDEWSDAVCTALQLANFWQDLEIDWRKGRVYLPLSIVQAANADLQDLGRRRMSPEWQRALSDVTGRTRALFASGRPVADGVRGRLRWELRATWLGGMRILDKLERAKFDVFRKRPKLGGADMLPIAWRTITWQGRAQRAARGNGAPQASELGGVQGPPPIKK